MHKATSPASELQLFRCGFETGSLGVAVPRLKRLTRQMLRSIGERIFRCQIKEEPWAWALWDSGLFIVDSNQSHGMLLRFELIRCYFLPDAKLPTTKTVSQAKLCFPLPNLSDQGRPAGRPCLLPRPYLNVWPLSVEIVVMVQLKILPSARQWKRTIKGLHSAPSLLFTCRMGIS